MATTHLPVLGGHPQGAASTCRQDAWYAGPLATLLFLCTALAYMTWAALQGNHYYADPYLSPLYSPVIFTDLSAAGAAPSWHAWVGNWPAWWPAALPLSPALLILPFPASFRFTCYYYRKAYYRSFSGSPPSCWVSPVSGRNYKGETSLLLFQNLHRYAMYFAVIFLAILFYDAAVSFYRRGEGFGIGVGSIVLTINFLFLSSYTFGCHSFRHMIGGGADVMAGKSGTFRHLRWKFSTWFNRRHMAAAWISLAWVSLTDVYVRLVSMGAINDLNSWN
ncbi:MAG: hypothetical protein OXU20_32945 [Myxococcales bacterium]|nr:hypothetical protein [Myxococcales bacterium]